MSHMLLKVCITNPILPICRKIDVLVGTDKLDQLSQITRPLGKGGRLQTNQDVSIVALIPNLLETPNEGNVCIPVMTKGICRTVYSPMPAPLDLRACRSVAQAPSTQIIYLLGVARETYSAKPAAKETSTQTLDVHQQMV